MVIAARPCPSYPLGRFLHRLCNIRAPHRGRTCPGALAFEAEDPCTRGNQQLLGRDMQLHGHVQFPDMVPDRLAY